MGELYGQALVCLLMEEKRPDRRQRVLKGAKVVYANGSIVVDFVIRNVSTTGALLKVPTSVGSKGRPAVVVWRKVGQIGIRFE